MCQCEAEIDVQNFRTTSDEKISNEIFFSNNNKGKRANGYYYIKGI